MKTPGWMTSAAREGARRWGAYEDSALVAAQMGVIAMLMLSVLLTETARGQTRAMKELHSAHIYQEIHRVNEGRYARSLAELQKAGFKAQPEYVQLLGQGGETFCMQASPRWRKTWYTSPEEGLNNDGCGAPPGKQSVVQ